MFLGHFQSEFVALGLGGFEVTGGEEQGVAANEIDGGADALGVDVGELDLGFGGPGIGDAGEQGDGGFHVLGHFFALLQHGGEGDGGFAVAAVDGALEPGDGGEHVLQSVGSLTVMLRKFTHGGSGAIESGFKQPVLGLLGIGLGADAFFIGGGHGEHGIDVASLGGLFIPGERFLGVFFLPGCAGGLEGGEAFHAGGIALIGSLLEPLVGIGGFFVEIFKDDAEIDGGGSVGFRFRGLGEPFLGLVEILFQALGSIGVEVGESHHALDGFPSGSFFIEFGGLGDILIRPLAGFEHLPDKHIAIGLTSGGGLLKEIPRGDEILLHDLATGVKLAEHEHGLAGSSGGGVLEDLHSLENLLGVGHEQTGKIQTGLFVSFFRRLAVEILGSGGIRLVIRGPFTCLVDPAQCVGGIGILLLGEV